MSIRDEYTAILRQRLKENGIDMEYLGWTDAGQVIAPGVWPVGAVNGTKYPEQAYLLGKRI